ncbi:MAG TPA: GTPase domain-containing protein [Blastocatellia bacterium]|nr:GTPase domain-containing protein [Blastocatellia bacterium]
MVQFNFSERTIKAKVVYYGPPQSGKTTNLEQIHRISDPEGANRLISLNTAQDRTLFFDLLPFSLGSVSGYDFKIQLYTVPGQVQYNATRRVVLAGADAVVFVADSRRPAAKENQAAFENMKVNLLANRLVPEKVPLVVQYNKQDIEPLVPREELDRTLNFWGRRAFPAVAARGEGVMETFAAVVQEMLATIAVKYNLKEKGLDPESVPEIVAQAFAEIVRKAPPRPASGPAPPAPKVVIAEPQGVEPAYPGQVGPEVNPVSEELLNRAIRANVELAQTLSQLVREVHEGLGVIQVQSSRLAASSDDAHRGSLVAAIEHQVKRMQQMLRETGQPAGSRAPGPPQTAPTPPRGITAPAPPPRPSPTPAPPLPFPSPARPAAAQQPPVARPAVPAAPGPAAVAAVAGLDGLVAEMVHLSRPALAARPVRVEVRMTPGTPLPRCSPIGLKRSFAALFQGLSAVVAPQSAIVVRAEKKPVLFKGRDGSQQTRDFLMIAATHAGGLADADQQRVLQGADAGPLGEAQRLVREMGGFIRFAPLPGGALETRIFLPA